MPNDDDIEAILGGDLLPSLCDNGCGRALRRAPSAPHKRFCSDACRMQWHSRRRAEAMRLWEQAQARDQGNPRDHGNAGIAAQSDPTPTPSSEPV